MADSKDASYQRGILRAKPLEPQSPAWEPGVHLLERSPGGEVFVPERHSDGPMPLLVLLHGAGGSGSIMLPTFREKAEQTGTLILAPNSAGSTWDVIQEGYGPDVEHIDQALQDVFRRFPMDPAHLAIGGFSDGASYALSLGIINGGLFSHVLAFAPGFVSPTITRDSPRIFMTHGTQDKVLPIDACSRRIVSRLRQAGYDLAYHEFAGGHSMPGSLVAEGFRWFLGKGHRTGH